MPCSLPPLLAPPTKQDLTQGGKEVESSSMDTLHSKTASGSWLFQHLSLTVPGSRAALGDILRIWGSHLLEINMPKEAAAKARPISPGPGLTTPLNPLTHILALKFYQAIAS